MSTTLHKPALLCALLASGCVTELDVDPLVPLEPTVAATYDEQALNRLLVTMATPSDTSQPPSCVGVLLARDLEDGVPGQDLALPPGWGLELAYRARSAAECHGVWPQLHRITEAGSTRSTKTFFSSTIASPAGERKPWNTLRKA